ncbi:unnamed protein product [Ectocarpus sp. 8 AP-2014]
MFTAKKITLYKIRGCSACDQALEYLRKRDVSPVVYLVEDETPDMAELVETTRCSTFPQIFVDSVFVGGLSDLKRTTIYRPTEFRRREMRGDIVEPMCVEEEDFDRFILFNGKTEHEYADVYRLYKKQTALFWVVEEIDLSGDSKDWEDASSDEKHFLKLVLAFFASLDQIVMENIGLNFKNEIVIPQIRQHFAIQEATEAVHAESYSLLIQTYFRDTEEQRHVMRSIQTMPIIEKKALWAEKWMNPETASLAERLVGFTCLEGVQFSGSFCAIYWLKKRQKFKGLSFANSLIARDEGLHATASVLIYKHLENKLPRERVHEIFKHAVSVECEFISSALPVALIGISEKSMTEYIKFVADYWLHQLGYDKVYNSVNPFEWMDMISLQGKTNFFENRVAEYSKPGVLLEREQQQFCTDADF